MGLGSCPASRAYEPTDDPGWTLAKAGQGDAQSQVGWATRDPPDVEKAPPGAGQPYSADVQAVAGNGLEPNFTVYQTAEPIGQPGQGMCIIWMGKCSEITDCNKY